MKWTLLLTLLLIGLVAGNAWKQNQKYNYKLKSRTLTALPELNNQWVGIITKARLFIHPQSENILIGQVTQAEYAEIHQQLAQGWDSDLDESQLTYHNWPLSEKPFEVHLKNGVIRSLAVDRTMTNDQINQLKSIVSQLQVDTNAQNGIKNKYSQFPERNSNNAVYKTMEPSLTGNCETIYDISPLPEYLTQSHRDWVPMPELKGNGEFIDVVKTKNYSNCNERIGYHFGITGHSHLKPNTNQMGDALSRSEVSRIILSGSLKHYTIQSSVTTNKVAVSPTLYDVQQAMTVAYLHVTLESIEPTSKYPQIPFGNLLDIGNLVYTYNLPSDSQNHARPKNNTDSSSSSSSSSSSDSSSSSSSESGSNSSSSPSHSSDESFISNRLQQEEKQKRKNDHNRNLHNNENKSRSRRSILNDNEKKKNNKQLQQQHADDDNSSSSGSDSGSSFSSNSESTVLSSSSSQSIDNSEQYRQPKPSSLKNAPESPLLPMFIGYKGNSIQNAKKINGVVEAEKMAQEIGKDLRKPSQIARADTLEKFMILTRFLRTMNGKQIDEVQRQLYASQEQTDSQSTKSIERNAAWKAFRDATAEAGTPPTANQVLEWVEQKKVKGEEAAQLIAAMGRSIRTPTDQFLQRFFHFATSAQIQEHIDVKTTALMSFSEAINRAKVNKKSSYNFYPVHSFGRLANRSNEIVTKQVIPYFAKQLKQAVKDKDSQQTQVYIRVLGNLGHPNILGVFEPYLEGQIQVTPFQRLAIVVALDTLVQNYPRLTRSVLYKIYQNVGEAHPVRCAAVFQLMHAVPTTAMLQRMAEFTHHDSSSHVNSAVKSAIKSAAHLTESENQELAANAKAAEKFLHEEQDGLQYSRSYLHDFVVKEMNLGYTQQIDYIGSQDEIIPNAVFLASKRNYGGFKRYSEYYAMVSSIHDLTDILNDQYNDSKLNNQPEYPRNTRNQFHKQRDQHKSNNQWSTEEIAQMLNIKTDDAEQLEGQLMFNIMSTRRFFAFDNQTIERIPQYVRNVANQIHHGQQINFTKLYNQAAVTISFPLVTGFPFIFTLEKPTLVQAAGEARMQTNPSMANGNNDEIVLPKSANISAKVEMTYSTLVSVKVSFITPFNHQRYTAGFAKKAQVYLPLNMKADIDLRNNEFSTEIQPLHTTQNPTVLHMSNWPYTSRQDILQLRPVAESKDTKLIHVRAPQKMDQYYGQHTTGMAFHVQIQHEKRFADLAALFEQLRRFDMTSALSFSMLTMPDEQYNIEVQFDFQRSSTKSAKITMSYDDDLEDNGAEPSDPKHPRSREIRSNAINAANPSSKSPNSHKRREEFLRNAAAGITHSKASVVDIAVEFNGYKQENSEYIATIAFADSPVDPNARVLFFASASHAKQSAEKMQICMAANAKFPNTPELNFKHAIEHDGTSNVDVHLQFGVGQCQHGSDVTMKAKLKQSEERKQFVRKTAFAKQCFKQMEQGDYLLPACRVAIDHANKLDQYQINIDYEHIPVVVKNAAQKLYSMGRQAGYEYLSEENEHSGKEGRVELDARIAPNMQSAQVTLKSPSLQAHYENIRLNQFEATVFGVHPSVSLMERLEMHLTRNSDVCAVDQNQINTFDYSAMQHELGKCWHIMMQTVEPRSADPSAHLEFGEINHYEQVSVLVRGIDTHKKQVMIILGQKNGADYTVKLSPGQNENSTPLIFINDQQQHPTEKIAHEIYSDDDEDQPILRAYAQPEGEIKVEIRDAKLEITYDGTRVKLRAHSSYRNNVRGICGTYTGEKETDMKSPKNCVLRRSHHFIASWALVDQDCQGPAKEWQREAAEATCLKENILYGNVISESEAGRKRAAKQANGPFESSSSDSSDSSSSSSSSESVEKRTKQSNDKQIYNNKNQCRTLFQTQYAHVADKICFTSRQLLTCTKGCRAEGKKPRSVDVYCIHENEPSAQHYLKQIKRGVNPHMDKYPPNSKVSFNLPQHCVSVN